MINSYIREVADAISAKTDDPSPNDLLYLVYAVLALTKGETVTASDVHDAWSAVAEYEGTATEAVVPFALLAESVRRRDARFVVAVREVARERKHRLESRHCEAERLAIE